MSYSICIIDDALISVAAEYDIDHDGLLNSVVLSLLIEKKKDWQDKPLRCLYEKLLSEKDNSGNKIWQVYAFTLPDFYFNSFEQELFRSDVIIFDWNYDVPIDQEETLHRILKESYSLVYIYSGPAQEHEIKNVLNKPAFKEFKKRVKFIDKLEDWQDASKSSERLISDAKKLYKDNFSFKFGRKLRNISIQALDKILVRLGELHIEDTLEFLGATDNETVGVDLKQMVGEKIKHHLREDSDLETLLNQNGLGHETSEQLIDLVAKKISNDVITADLTVDSAGASEGTFASNKDIVSKLWSYRIYHNPCDNFVRRGDIVYEANTGSYSVLYLVVTADCDLYRFWNKNLGYIDLVKLYCAIKEKERINELGKLTKSPKDLRKVKINSFSDPIQCIGGSPLWIPFVPVEDQLFNYMLFPKEIISKYIEMPQELREKEARKERDKQLTYSYWNKFERLTTISEPFLTPMIQHILETVSGYGTPDYCEDLKTSMANEYKDIFS